MITDIQDKERSRFIRNANSLKLLVGVMGKAASEIGIEFLSPYDEAVWKGGSFKNTQNGEEKVFPCNSLIPHQEVFDILTTPVRPIDEPFLTRRGAFRVDQSGDPGVPRVGIEIITEEGEAKDFAASSAAGGKEIGRESNVTISREFNFVRVAQTTMVVTREALLSAASRNRIGAGATISLLQEVIRVGRKNVMRREDEINVKGAGSTDAKDRVPGLLDAFGTASGQSPTANVTTTGTGGTDALKRRWANKTAKQIIEGDLSAAVKELRRTGAFEPKLLLLPQDVISDIVNKYSSDTNTTPLIEWIKKSWSDNFNSKITIMGTNALNTTNSGQSVQVFILADNAPQNQAFARPLDVTLLNPVLNAHGDITQVAEIRTAGFFNMHPKAMYMGKGI